MKFKLKKEKEKVPYFKMFFVTRYLAGHCFIDVSILAQNSGLLLIFSPIGNENSLYKISMYRK